MTTGKTHRCRQVRTDPKRRLRNKLFVTTNTRKFNQTDMYRNNHYIIDLSALLWKMKIKYRPFT